jgi:hypothetical protein
MKYWAHSADVIFANLFGFFFCQSSFDFVRRGKPEFDWIILPSRLQLTILFQLNLRGKLTAISEF